MSRFVAGFVTIIYVFAVSGQQYPSIRLKGNPDDPSIAISVISGGNYPPGSFNIGYGDGNDNGDGTTGVHVSVNTGNGQTGFGGQGQNGLGINGQGKNGQGQNGQGQNGQGQNGQGQNGQGQNGPGINGPGYVNGQNDLDSYGGLDGSQNVVNEYGVPLQNPGQKPPNPYDVNNQQNNNVPVRNSATRNKFLSRFLNYILSWFY